MSTWWSDCSTPTVDTMGGADLVPVYSQANGARRNISAANMRTFMQDGVTIANGLLGLSSVYEMYQTAATYNYGLQTSGTEFALSGGFTTTRVLPAGRTALAINVTTGEFILQRDCQAVFVNAQTATLGASTPVQQEIRVKVIGASGTYTSPLRAVCPGTFSNSYVATQLNGVLCNPLNANNYLRAGDKIVFYGVWWGTSPVAIYNTQYLSVQTMDGV